MSLEFVRIGGTLRFQACSDDVCEPPQTIKFTLPLTIEPGVPHFKKIELKQV